MNDDDEIEEESEPKVLCDLCEKRPALSITDVAGTNARAEAAESERDRQYEFNAGMIAKLAAAESQVAALTGHLAKMECPVCRESLGRPHSEFWKDCSDCEEQRAALSHSKEAAPGKDGF
jgi:hypothetical protein